jgi:hypothetical protein
MAVAVQEALLEAYGDGVDGGGRKEHAEGGVKVARGWCGV